MVACLVLVFLVLLTVGNNFANIMKTHTDLSLTTLTSNGEISQILYANKRIANDMPMLAFHDRDSKTIVLISLFSAGSSIQFDKNVKSHVSENEIFVIGVGYVSDLQSLFKYMERVIQSHKVSSESYLYVYLLL
jgi:20S proteasome alpha/beta subunit